ncbi:hypothetical protein, partial [Acidiferrobacter sp.]|uniref:hypothetical protein n=1 Tax=Acidiferrobacter sp. TaxID=1872107 RepID=UPI00261176A8
AWIPATTGFFLRMAITPLTSIAPVHDERCMRVNVPHDPCNFSGFSLKGLTGGCLLKTGVYDVVGYRSVSLAGGTSGAKLEQSALL